MIYIYSYDIADPRRLRKTARRLEQFGVRIQKSVFQCDAPKRLHLELIRMLRSELNRRTDSLRVYPLCRNCADAIEYEGDQPLIEVRDYVIL